MIEYRNLIKVIHTEKYRIGHAMYYESKDDAVEIATKLYSYLVDIHNKSLKDLDFKEVVQDLSKFLSTYGISIKE